MSGAASIDLNADVGEGAGNDAQLIPLVTSVNIACGAHAGGLEEMRAAVSLSTGRFRTRQPPKAAIRSARFARR